MPLGATVKEERQEGGESELEEEEKMMLTKTTCRKLRENCKKNCLVQTKAILP